MATDYDIPRPDDILDGSLTVKEVQYLLGLIADNLSDAQAEIGNVLVGSIDAKDVKTNLMHAAIAQSHSTQAQSLTLYLVLCARLER